MLSIPCLMNIIIYKTPLQLTKQHGEINVYCTEDEDTICNITKVIGKSEVIVNHKRGKAENERV